MVTLSRLQLAACCPGSASLPRYAREGDRAPTLGRAIHEVVQAMVEGVRDGIDTAHLWADILEADDEGRLNFIAEHLRLPVPAGAMAEVALGWWPDGRVHRIEGGAGEYPDVGQWLSGTIDCLWVESDGVTWCVDWKCGSEDHVPPIDRNLQLRGGAVLAARWTGATKVIPAICYINAAECAEAVRRGETYAGRWECGAPLDAAALDAVEAEMRVVLARARGEGDGYALDGREPDRRVRHIGEDGRRHHDHAARTGDVSGLSRAPLILGPHCEHCPARGACPALAAEAVSLLGAWKDASDAKTRDDTEPVRLQGGSVGAQTGVESDAGAAHGAVRGFGVASVPDAQALVDSAAHGEALPLTPTSAAHLAGIIPALRRILDAAEVAVRAHVEAIGAPLTLADGREYGPVVEPVTEYLTRPTYEALAAVVGDARADEAFGTTGTALRAAIAGQPRGAWGRLKSDLEARGAVVASSREVWRKRWAARPVEVDDARTSVRELQRPDGSGGSGAPESDPNLHGGGAERRTERGDGVLHPAAPVGVGGARHREEPSGVPVSDDESRGGYEDPPDRSGEVLRGRLPETGVRLAHAPPMAPGARADNVPPGVRDAAPPDGDQGRLPLPGEPVGGPARDLDGPRPAVSSTKGKCPVCGRVYGVNRDGTMRAHGSYAAGSGGLYCTGRGKLPVA